MQPCFFFTCNMVVNNLHVAHKSCMLFFFFFAIVNNLYFTQSHSCYFSFFLYFFSISLSLILFLSLLASFSCSQFFSLLHCFLYSFSLAHLIFCFWLLHIFGLCIQLKPPVSFTYFFSLFLLCNFLYLWSSPFSLITRTILFSFFFFCSVWH